ncbi:histone-like nucleoid-structuring protein Lsr2 [Streptomyces phaeochromogenes]
MAEQVILVDDLDASRENVERVDFSWLGKDYEIDLTRFHVEEYSELLAPLLKAARPKSTGRKGRSNRQKADAAEMKRVRDWARANGFHVPADRGPVPKDARQAYAAAQAAGTQSTVPPQGHKDATEAENPYANR